jgi:hypothetical protein
MKSELKKAYVLIHGGLWKKVDYHIEKAGSIWHEFWTMLICGGWCFTDEDLVELQKLCKNEQRKFWAPSEYNYAQAVRINNISFCRAYECLLKRTPFVCDNVDYGNSWGHLLPYGMHSTQAKSQGRLVLWAKFHWNGDLVKVTSFNDAEQFLIACAYYPKEENKPERIRKRYTITAEDFKTAIKKIKDAKKQSNPAKA